MPSDWFLFRMFPCFGEIVFRLLLSLALIFDERNFFFCLHVDGIFVHLKLVSREYNGRIICRISFC